MKTDECTTDLVDKRMGVQIKRKTMNTTTKSQMQTIVKRDGKIVPFQKMRIEMALTAAFRDTKKLSLEAPIPQAIQQTIEKITNLVIDEALKRAKGGQVLTVEGIQDIVEVKLMEQGLHDIARDYILYREERKQLRADSPRHMKVLRRDSLSSVRFNPMKIATALENGFRDTYKVEGPLPDDVTEAINQLTAHVILFSEDAIKEGINLNIEMIQDEIERELMREGHFDVARDYILYRARRTEKRKKEIDGEGEEKTETPQEMPEEAGNKRAQFKRKVTFACKGYEPLVSPDEIIDSAIANFYEGMKEEEVDLATILAARAKIEVEPAYNYVTANLLLDVIYRETMKIEAASPKLKEKHKKYFVDYFRKGVSVRRLDPALLSFDLEKLSNAIDLERDHIFTYLGLQTLYDRYFISNEGQRLETPQIFWMRVAMGLSLNEGSHKEERAIEFYNVLSKFLFISGTPTLFNAGTLHSQLSSCYLSTVMDDLSHIYKVVSDDAQLSKWAGGLGNDWTNVRATGALIKGTNGRSQGVIPFLKVANDTAVAVNQCFAPETGVYTNKGLKPISEVKIGDLVLGKSGIYREVLDTFTYNQKDPVVRLHVKHAIESLTVTSGHPFFAIRNVPMEQSIERTMDWLEKGKICSEWVEASELKKGDYVAQVIPKEVVKVEGVDVEDARLYGILLGDGHLTKNSNEWGVSGNPEKDEHLQFVRNYLQARGIHYWETGRGQTYVQVRWATGKGALRNATTGRYVDSGDATLPFDYEDLYDKRGHKHIAPRLSHLPPAQTKALIRGLLETDGNVSRNKEISFTNTSQPLVEGLRYQLLRLGVPTSGKFRVRQNGHSGKHSDGSSISFKNETSCYDLRIPAVSEIAELVGCNAVIKRNWLTCNGIVFTRVKKCEKTEVIPFVCDLKVDGDESYMTTAGLAHNGGKRKGAMCAYLETWHLDIEDFLELRKNTGDERRRTHDMNTANWIPDLFMKRILSSGTWTLFSPNDVPDLHHLCGKSFETKYIEYEKMADRGQIKLFKRVDALTLWRKMLGMLYETGHPWITFKDPSNIRSPQDHVGVVHSSNLCTEILLNTSAEETAVCNLGSLNLPALMSSKGINRELLASTIRTAIRMLDNVIDINFYPIEESRRANMRHRPVGLGLMGFQDALYILNISYSSEEAVQFADESMELISYYAILSSSELAKERGPYSTYKGSKWDHGILPIDSIALLAKERGEEFVDMDDKTSLDWSPIRESIRKYGMRNSNTMAIAPTATIANISGITQSIEPMYKHLFVKSNLSGEFTVLNPFLVNKLKELGLWDLEMLDDLKYFDGSIAEIDRIPDEVKKIFLTSFEIEPDWLIECASRRQKWIDMGQSLNLYLAEPSGKKLNLMYLLAWKKGLKTTYYLRALAATHVEKSTTDINKRGIQPRWMKSESPSGRIVVERESTPKACRIGDESCESCQ